MSYNKEFLKELKENRKTYSDMIDFCCDDLILNNYIMEELSKNGYYFDLYCGTDYDEENDTYFDIYQYFIISERDAERLSEYTNEIVFYNEQLDLYLLAVTHVGMRWDYVPANWKELDAVDEDD